MVRTRQLPVHCECGIEPIGLYYSFKRAGTILWPVRRSTDMEVVTGWRAEQEADMKRQHAAAEMARRGLGFLAAIRGDRSDDETFGRLGAVPTQFGLQPSELG